MIHAIDYPKKLSDEKIREVLEDIGLMYVSFIGTNKDGITTIGSKMKEGMIFLRENSTQEVRDVFHKMQREKAETSDGKFSDYSELEQYLKGLPATWYPALIIEMVTAAYEKNVFVNGGASQLVKSAEKRLGKSNE